MDVQIIGLGSRPRAANHHIVRLVSADIPEQIGVFGGVFKLTALEPSHPGKGRAGAHNDAHINPRPAHPFSAARRIPDMIEEQSNRRVDRPLREWSGTYGGFYLLPGDAWGVSVAADGTPHARCCSCSWEYNVATEEEAVRMVTAHLRVAHPDESGSVNPAGRTTATA